MVKLVKNVWIDFFLKKIEKSIGQNLLQAIDYVKSNISYKNENKYVFINQIVNLSINKFFNINKFKHRSQLIVRLIVKKYYKICFFI